MIRFAIDIRMWNNSGIGNYLQNLVPIIIRNNPDYNFILYGNREILIREKILEKSSNIKIVNFIAPIYSIKEQLYFCRIIIYSNMSVIALSFCLIRLSLL